MAASNQKNDLVQIVMLTFFLCAVFFAGWGVFSNVKVQKNKSERDKQLANLKSLETLIENPASKESLKNDRRRKESEENSSRINVAVDAVLKKSTLEISKADSKPGRPAGGGGRQNRVFEYEYVVSFKPARIDEVYRFLAMLEQQAPHLEFKRIEVNSQKRKETDPDDWVLALTLVTYTTES